MTVPGDRIRLEHTSDPHTRLRPGALGTVAFIDSLGTVQCAGTAARRSGSCPGTTAGRS